MESVWINSIQNNYKNKKINNDYNADVCIIGAGMCGLTTAYYLSKQGYKVIVVDKEKLFNNTSGNTTAKITLQHNLIYDYLINNFNEDFALKYYESNKEAISNIKSIIDEEKIECDFEYVSNYVFSDDLKDFEKIQNEVEAINMLERKNSMKKVAKFVKETELPFEISAGIKLENQAQFNPTKYMLGLIKAIERNDGIVFTDTIVTDINKDSDSYIVHANDNKIIANKVVLASHYPFINFPGMYFSKMYQVTSYAIAIEIENNLIDGMYISLGEPILSFRTARFKGKKILIIAGGNHKTGFSPDSKESFGYKFLINKANELFPNNKLLFKWNTSDCITLDKIPYIGEFSFFSNNLYVATGFNKWGMTLSNVAGNIISDSISKKNNKYANIYDSTRFKPVKNKEELMNMAKQTINSFVLNKIKIPNEDISAIENDNGAILKIDGNKVGVYKDEQGNVFLVNPVCTHLGCLLTWNNIDKTWDCPCHGSRFDYTGKSIHDPAYKNLDISNTLKKDNT